MNSEPSRCVLCGLDTQLGAREAYGEYTLFSCSACAGQFWWPFKNPGSEWYEKDDRYHGRNLDPLLTPVDTHLLFLKDRPLPGGTLLDVGCGTGNFLAAARQDGYAVAGIDFDTDAVAVAQTVFHLPNITAARIEDVVSTQKTYDVITFFEVLEHLDDPKTFLDCVYQLLNPGGYIALSVPDASSWEPFKKHDKPPRHLTRWTVASMKRFLSANQFRVVRIEQKTVPLSFLITKFHFWTGKYFSFNLVNRVRQTQVTPPVGSSVSSSVKVPTRQSLVIRCLKVVARIKDIVLFTLPASVLWIYLRVRGLHSCGLYVLAQRVEN